MAAAAFFDEGHATTSQHATRGKEGGMTRGNKVECWITKATVQPTLEDAAARIAAVVEAERPANRPTLKGLIHKDADKTTKELCCHIQSLEAKLSATAPKSMAKMGRAVAQRARLAQSPP
jgi:hypothetical protein